MRRRGLAGRIYGYRDYCDMRQFNCGYWVIEWQLADLRRVFEHVGSYTSGFLSMLAPIHIRRVFRRVFVVFFGRMGPIYVGFWLGFSWFFGLGFRGFWAGFSSFVVFGG